MRYLVGAYPAYPPGDPLGQAELLTRLAANRLVAGLELPFTGSEPPRVPDGADPGWTFAITAIPGTVTRNREDPGFGLASPDPAGRRRALDFTAALRDYVQAVVESTRPGAVVAVEIHSAPSRQGVAAVFADSLAEVAAWDWHGAVVTVEHCDADDGVAEPQKGYLGIGAEIRAVRTAARGAGLGMTINWARSAIERRDAAAPAEHLALARGAGVLSGLMFSGCSDRDGDFGGAWLDAHLPPGVPGSLLSAREIRASWKAAGGVAFAGLKMGIRPATAGVGERVRQLSAALKTLEQSRS